MRIGFFANFIFPHIGGSEFVLKNISEILIKGYKYQVDIYGFSYNSI